MLERYESIIFQLTRRSKTHIHYKSLKNFIVHIEHIPEGVERGKALNILSIYLEDIESKIEEIDRVIARVFFLEYILPLAAIYTKIGFIKILHIRFALMLSLPFDIVIGLIFFTYPYPILSSLLVIKEIFKRIKHKDSSKYYCMFH